MNSGFSISRRAVLAAGPLVLTAHKAAAAPRAHLDSIQVITQQPRYYHAWATLAKRASGELVIAYSGGREAHVCPFGRVEFIRSADRGQTWSWPQVVMDTPIDDRDAGVLETSKGSLLVTTFTSLAFEKVFQDAKGWDAERVERWKSVWRSTTAEQRIALLGAWMLRSTDSGLTWSTPYRVPVTSPHGPVALKDGSLLYLGKQYPGEGARIGAWRSPDDGLSWQWHGGIPPRPGDDPVQYHELHAVEVGDGRIVAHIRNHNPANDRETLQSESPDGGKTWSVPRPIGVWGLPSHLLRLQDGRLMMTYGYRRAPRGNHARLSEDGGRTWSEPVVLSDDGTGDLGYPATVELADGEFLTVWYEAKPPQMSVLRQLHWTLAH